MQILTLFKKSGRYNDALQYCYDLVEEDFLRNSRIWHSNVVELCEAYKVRNFVIKSINMLHFTG